MATVEKELVYIMLENITSKANLTRVIFSIRKKPSMSPSSYVSFNFYSFDLMYTILKSMARIYKACSIENLYNQSFPAKIEVLRNFNSPDTLEALYLAPDAAEEVNETPDSSKLNYYANLYVNKYAPKEYLWPSNGVKGFFILDDEV